MSRYRRWSCRQHHSGSFDATISGNLFSSFSAQRPRKRYPLYSLMSSCRPHSCRSTSLQSIRYPARILGHPHQLISNVRHCGVRLGDQDVPELSECLRFAAQPLVVLLHELDKFARVDVRIAPAVDVLDHFGRNGDWQGRSGVGQCGERCYQRCTSKRLADDIDITIACSHFTLHCCFCE